MYKKFVFVCENKREAGVQACGEAGVRLRELLKEVVQSEQLSGAIRICRSGCLDACEKGPAILIEPDHVLCERVEDSDLPKILNLIRSA